MAAGASAGEWEQFARDIGLRLHRARLSRELSQERLAAAAGITTFTYRKLEHGESNPGMPSNPRLRTLVALAEVLELDLAELLASPPRGVAVGR